MTKTHGTILTNVKIDGEYISLIDKNGTETVIKVISGGRENVKLAILLPLDTKFKKNKQA